MKRFLCALLIAVMALIVSGCRNSAEGTDDFIADGEHFTLIKSWGYNGYYCAVLKHNETGVCYFFTDAYNSTAMTVMLNPDGTPYTGKWDGDK